MRAAALLAVSVAAAGFLAKAVLAPVPLERPLAAFVFPAPLPGWEADAADDPAVAFYRSTAGGASMELSMRFIPEVHALHFQNMHLAVRMPPSGEVPLDVDMHFLVTAAGGVKMNEKGGELQPAPLEIRKSAAGFHGFWEDGTRLHLTALLGPDGQTAVTSPELLSHVLLPQFRPRRIARWLFAGAPLPDNRCILADLSVPADAPPDQMRSRLEEAWVQWRGWIGPRFTKLCAEADGS